MLPRWMSLRRVIEVTYKGNRGVGISYLLSSDIAKHLVDIAYTTG